MTLVFVVSLIQTGYVLPYRHVITCCQLCVLCTSRPPVHGDAALDNNHHSQLHVMHICPTAGEAETNTANKVACGLSFSPSLIVHPSLTRTFSSPVLHCSVTPPLPLSCPPVSLSFSVGSGNVKKLQPGGSGREKNQSSNSNLSEAGIIGLHPTILVTVAVGQVCSPVRIGFRLPC